MSRTSKKDTLNELESKINGLERSNFDLKLRLHYLNSKYGHLENNDSRNGGYGEYDLREEIQSLTEENEYYKKKIVDLETEVLRLQVAREKEAEKYQEALRMKPAALQQAEEQRKREREVSQAIAEHDAALIAKLQEELQQLHTERAGHQMLVSDLNDKINKLVQLADDKDTEIDSLVKTVRDMRATIDTLTAEQQKLTNLADAASRPIVVTTNTSGQQTSVTLNAATTVNTSSLAQTQAQAALPPFPHANSTYNSKFHGYSSAYSHQLPSTTSIGVQPAGQSIAVTQQSMGPQQSTVSVTATPGRPSLAGATTSNVTISSSSMNDAASRYTSSAYRPSSTALPLGAVRGASTTAGLQHTLNNTVLPPNTPAHSSLPHHYSQYPSAAIDESVNQSLHASTLMAPVTNTQHVSFAQTQSQPQAMTFMSSLPDGSPVRTTVSTSQPHPQHTVVNVSSVPVAAPPGHNASAMQEQFQLSMQQASLDASSYSRNDATTRPTAGAAASNITTTTTTLTNVNGGVTATVAQQNVANPAVVDTSYVVHDPATGQPYHHIQIQQQQQHQALYDPAQSRMETLQQSIYTTEQMIQRLRQNAHELSLLDNEEVVRLEQELQKSKMEKDQLKQTPQGPPTAQSQGRGMMSMRELNQPQHYGAASSYETNQPPPLYEVPVSSPLRSTRVTTTTFPATGTTTTTTTTNIAAPPAPAAQPSLLSSYRPSTSYLQPPSSSYLPSPSQPPSLLSTPHQSTSHYTTHAYRPTTTVSVTSTPGAPSQPLSSSALGHSYSHRSSLAPAAASVATYRSDLVAAGAATPLPVTTTVTTTTALPDAAVVGAASARGSDVTAYERTIDMYKYVHSLSAAAIAVAVVADAFVCCL